MGKYLNIIRQAEESQKLAGQDKEPGQGQCCQADGFPRVPGKQITWQGADGKKGGPATVDFLHVGPDGSMWAFCATPAGWTAVNLRYAINDDRGT